MSESVGAQPFRRLVVDALMSAAPFPILLLFFWMAREEADSRSFPIIIIGFYLLAALTVTVAAWRILRRPEPPALRKRCFFVMICSLLLSAPYLVIYWILGSRGSDIPWWGMTAFILFMAHIPVLFLERQRCHRNKKPLPGV